MKTETVLIIVVSIFALIILAALIFKKKILKISNNNDEKEIAKNSFVDIKDKFMFQKEFKVLKILNKILPTGFLAYPKISVKSLIEPMGNVELYSRIKDKLVDVVIFEENTLKPVIVVDIFDNSPGDEELESEYPLVVKAFEMASLPIVKIKVKPDYYEQDIKEPIYKVLMPRDIE